MERALRAVEAMLPRWSACDITNTSTRIQIFLCFEIAMSLQKNNLYANQAGPLSSNTRWLQLGASSGRAVAAALMMDSSSPHLGADTSKQQAALAAHTFPDINSDGELNRRCGIKSRVEWRGEFPAARRSIFQPRPNKQPWLVRALGLTKCSNCGSPHTYTHFPFDLHWPGN